ncbi:MAG: nickel-responsive transcriptional regulator NikR [Bryobacterales bacterium]|jgi:CopG family nickel-responsive transcriptional regulator|nr:nickel-responsive transcriptional regulator NikR [Bryobacterales bacterium]
MPTLSRIGVAIESDLLDRFDSHIQQLGYQNRSEAFRDLIRNALTTKAIEDPDSIAMGTLTLLYDHHTGGLSARLTELQHEAEGIILSTMHIHVTHHLCLEVIVLRGRAGALERLAGGIGSQRGVLHAKLVIAAAGDVP